MRANQETLVQVARDRGDATASSWRAYRSVVGGIVTVWHYGTHMVDVYPDNTVVPVSRGWGSMTDKVGLRKILRNVSGQGYADVYAGF